MIQGIQCQGRGINIVNLEFMGTHFLNKLVPFILLVL